MSLGVATAKIDLLVNKLSLTGCLVFDTVFNDLSKRDRLS
jgi:hypothetical protein